MSRSLRAQKISVRALRVSNQSLYRRTRMIELGIVDLSASARRRLAALVERWAWVSPDSRVSIPRISIHLLSPEEVRFHGALDVCVVGPELIGCDAAYLTTLRRELNDKLILCVLDARTQSFGVIEQLGRLGVDDVLLESAGSDEFLRRLVLLQRRLRSRQRGRVIVVDSARGGVGATFVAALLAEGMVERGRTTCLVDGDYRSQDLTRFLQVKPHVSEPLRLLLEQQRLITGETVQECLHTVWSDEPRLRCVPPPAGSDDMLLASPAAVRSLVEVVETLAVLNERVVVDASPLGSGAKLALCQHADDVVFVANRDPSGAYANRQALCVVAGSMRNDARLQLVLNDCGRRAASWSLLERDVLSTLGRARESHHIPYSARAARWSCSGHTPYRFLRRHALSLLQDPVAAALEAQRHGAMRAAFGWCSDACRGTARRLCWWRKREKAVGPQRDGGREDRRYEPLALGFAENLLVQGELVSKPVLLG